MTDTDDENGKDRKLALTGLFFAKAQQRLRSESGAIDYENSASKIIGEKPTEDEIWNWMHDDVSEQRALEIRSHLAFDSELYETWRQFRIALSEEETEIELENNVENRVESDAPYATDKSTPQNRQATKSIKNSSESTSTQPMRVTGMAIAAAIMIFVLIKPLLFPGPPVNDFWQDWQTTKSTQTLDLQDDEKIQLRFLMGSIRQEMVKLKLGDTDPSDALLPDANCASQQTCMDNSDTLTNLGIAITNLRISCIQANAPTFDNLQSLKQSGTAALGFSELSLINPPLQELTNSIPNSSTTDNNLNEGLCRINDRIIERLLRAGRA